MRVLEARPPTSTVEPADPALPLVEAWGWRARSVTPESSLGEGATFALRIPRRPPVQ